MGPSVKFVSRINGSFSKRNYRSFFFSRKKGQTGARGVCQKGTIFSLFFLRHPSLIHICTSALQKCKILLFLTLACNFGNYHKFTNQTQAVINETQCQRCHRLPWHKLHKWTPPENLSDNFDTSSAVAAGQFCGTRTGVLGRKQGIEIQGIKDFFR